MKIIIDNAYTGVYDNKGDQIALAGTDKLSHAFFGGATNIGILPPAVRWVADDNSAMILERPPERHSIIWNGMTYSIPSPWMVYGIAFSNNALRGVSAAFAFGRPYSLFSKTDPLFTVRHPNIHKNGEFELNPTLRGLNYRYASRVADYIVPSVWQPILDQDVSGVCGASMADWVHRQSERSIEQSMEDLGDQSIDVPTIQDLIELLKSQTPKANTTIEFLKALVEKVGENNGLET